jgi:hypothetical protein
MRIAEIEVVHLLKSALDIRLSSSLFRGRSVTCTSERQHCASDERCLADLLQ